MSPNGEKIESKNFEKYVDLSSVERATPRAYEKVNAVGKWWRALIPVSFEQVSLLVVFRPLGGKHIDTVLNNISKRLADIILKKNKITVKPYSLRKTLCTCCPRLIIQVSIVKPKNVSLQCYQFGSKCTSEIH